MGYLRCVWVVVCFGLCVIRLVRLDLVMFMIVVCLVLAVSNYGNVLGWCG